MLSESNLLMIKAILNKIALGDSISISERIFVEREADKDAAISASLKRARRSQLNKPQNHYVDNLLNSLDLGSPDPDSFFNPKEDDLGDWFSGAPQWVSRS